MDPHRSWPPLTREGAASEVYTLMEPELKSHIIKTNVRRWLTINNRKQHGNQLKVAEISSQGM